MRVDLGRGDKCIKGQGHRLKGQGHSAELHTVFLRNRSQCPGHLKGIGNSVQEHVKITVKVTVSTAKQ